MSIQESKQIVCDYLAHFKGAAVPELLEAMSPDATWWILGKPHLFSGAGTKSKDDMARIWRGLFSHMKDGLQMTVVGMVAEDDKVAAEIRSLADLIRRQGLRESVPHALHDPTGQDHRSQGVCGHPPDRRHVRLTSA